MIRPLRAELRSSCPAIAAGWDWHIAPDTWHALIYCDPATGHARATRHDGTPLGHWTSPLDALQWLERCQVPNSRWLGYLSYDLGRHFESLPSVAADDLDLPLFAFVLGPHTPSTPAPPTRDAGVSPAQILTSTFTQPAYLDTVTRAIDYIAAGDIFQVNLSQRFSTPTDVPASQLFDRLHSAGGAWYGALLEFDTFSLISNSPELFLSVTPDEGGSRRVTTRPIKGTRPRSPGMRDQLLTSEKDQAELHMIVDLERNDLGRVCEIGSVRVTRSREIEDHPTVHHGAATVEGTLRRDVSLVDLLRATFPGGSITGAPKIRAMQIIEELEPVRRGPYCGAIGWIDPSGALQFNVAIRTMTLKDGLAHIPVGGGVVADSHPEHEYQETLVKARALFNALGVTGVPCTE